MYFDAVLDDDMVPLFNGTPEETLRWLRQNPDVHVMGVCVGSSMVVVNTDEYIAMQNSTA